MTVTKKIPLTLPSNRFKDLSWGEWHGMTGLDLARSGKLSDLMLISQRLKKSIGSCAQQYGHWSEQNRIIRDENAFSSCLDCIALPSYCSHTAFESSFIHSRQWKEPTYCPGGSLILRLSPHQETTLQMFTHKLQINYYFYLLLLHIKMCKMFKSGWLWKLQTAICVSCS